MLEENGLETRQAWLIDRPTHVEGEDGMEDWLAVFTRDLMGEPQRKMIAQKLRPTHYKEGVWTVDYRRLRIVAHKAAP